EGAPASRMGSFNLHGLAPSDAGLPDHLKGRQAGHKVEGDLAPRAGANSHHNREFVARSIRMKADSGLLLVTVLDEVHIQQLDRDILAQLTREGPCRTSSYLSALRRLFRCLLEFIFIRPRKPRWAGGRLDAKDLL